ncbi:MAG: hypothetical protein H5T85_09215 [Actinobacteria bacterium]|nr:hypothetical protein [Actinomycetota bacterium]
MFKHIKKNHPNLYAVLFGVSIIMFWRGLWGLMDLYLFPGNPVLSYAASALLGLLLLLLITDFRLEGLG